MSAAITLFILTVLLFVQSGGRTHRDWGSVDTRTFSHCCEVYLWHGPSSSRPCPALLCPALPWRGQTNIEELQRWCCPSRSTQFPVQTHRRRRRAALNTSQLHSERVFRGGFTEFSSGALLTFTSQWQTETMRPFGTMVCGRLGRSPVNKPQPCLSLPVSVKSVFPQSEHPWNKWRLNWRQHWLEPRPDVEQHSVIIYYYLIFLQTS